MGTKEWLIEKYELPNGTSPYDEWFDALSIDYQARIDARLDRVSLGNFGDCKSVHGGVYELRFSFGPGFRIYFGKYLNSIVLLLCGGDKSTQKKDIKTAQSLWKRFKVEMEGSN